MFRPFTSRSKTPGKPVRCGLGCALVVLIAMVGGLRLLVAAEPASEALASGVKGVPTVSPGAVTLAAVTSRVETAAVVTRAVPRTDHFDAVLAQKSGSVRCEVTGCGFERRASAPAHVDRGWQRLLEAATNETAAAPAPWAHEIAAPLRGVLSELQVQAADCGIHCTEPVHSRRALDVRF